MKKSFWLVIISLCMKLSLAQDLTSKMGEPILPQAKDWAIGVDATKLIKKASFDFVSNNQAIYFKYFVDAKTAIRVGARIGYNSWTTTSIVRDRAPSTPTVSYPGVVGLKENRWVRNTSATGLSFGLEKRRGSTRLQGVYGAEAVLFFSTTSDAFSYGNKLDATPGGKVEVDSKNDAMHSNVLGNANNIDTAASKLIQGIIGDARILKRRSGLNFSIGARAFIGAEYFVLPKLSIGGEFGYSLGVTLNGRSKTVVESKGISNTSATESVKQTTLDGPRSSSFHFDTDNSNIIGGVAASLKLNLYF